MRNIWYQNYSDLLKFFDFAFPIPPASVSEAMYVIREYLMAFWISPEVSTRDPIISPRALSRGLIMVEG